ncbi:glutaminyl-peptide cyclotransferase [Longitalea arenae]|uniref:glutaminyl-peptide cyclotransferase n=1 Tax=Longitalea arenae TaxID=2812558 RepID=UPI001967D6EA|nr:glutaminyl-peptide cyclotransferase [Longitalea arenae]
MKQILYLLTLIALLANCKDTGEDDAPVTPTISYEQTNYFFHDTSLYTEGLLVHNGQLFESTGSPDTFRKSLIGINDLKTGRFEKKTVFTNKKLFGEGISFFNNRLYQLTYKTQRGFIYDANSFKLLDSFTYKNKEGWGLTTDGRHLIMSDGTDTLTYLDPATLQPVKTLPIKENGAKRDSLNELEYIKGHIYANIWLTNNIVKINPADGQVTGKLDISPLAFKAALAKQDCGEPNGIAWDSATGHMYITGKLWPYIFQLRMP